MACSIPFRFFENGTRILMVEMYEQSQHNHRASLRGTKQSQNCDYQYCPVKNAYREIASFLAMTG